MTNPGEFFVPGDRLPEGDPLPHTRHISESEVHSKELDRMEAESQFLAYVRTLVPPFSDQQIQEISELILHLKVYKEIADDALRLRFIRAVHTELDG